MRHRRADDVDSLELLLDTVTNAFGGIMFLAILLSMMLKLSSKAESQSAPDAASIAAFEADAERLQELAAALVSLKAAAALKAESIEKLADPTTVQQYERLLDLRELRSEHETAIAKETAAAATAQAKLDAIRQEIAELERKSAEFTESVGAKKKEVRDRKLRSAQSLVPPHSQSTFNREVPVIVRYGRIYLQHDWSNDLSTRSPNLRDFAVIEEEGDSMTLCPIPTRGVKVAEGDDFKTSMRTLLQRHPPRNWYVCVAIWEDSFTAYQPLKKALIDLGYKIRLIPVSHGGKIFEGSIDNPQVQ